MANETKLVAKEWLMEQFSRQQLSAQVKICGEDLIQTTATRIAELAESYHAYRMARKEGIDE